MCKRAIGPDRLTGGQTSLKLETGNGILIRFRLSPPEMAPPRICRSPRISLLPVAKRGALIPKKPVIQPTLPGGSKLRTNFFRN